MVRPVTYVRYPAQAEMSQVVRGKVGHLAIVVAMVYQYILVTWILILNPKHLHN